MQNILMWACLAGLALFVPVLAGLWLHEKGINPVQELIGRFRRLPVLARLTILVFVANLIVYGSTKTNQVDGTSSPTNEPPLTGFALMPNLILPIAQDLLPDFDPVGEVVTNRTGFTPSEIASGKAVWRVGTNETWNFDAMPGAAVVDAWRKRGAAEDWTLCACSNAFTGPAVMDTLGRVCWSNTVYSALGLPLAFVPEANECLLCESNRPCVAWWTVTDWHSVVFTWQNALLGRATNVPVSVQAEFLPDGSQIYRYDLRAAGTNLTSVLYYPIGAEDLEYPDRDGDGIPTWQEVTEYHTDPGLVDSDGDGIPDAVEIRNGTDPTVRSVPNADIVSRIVGSPTNELYREGTVITNGTLVSMKLWDGFAADWDSTNDVVFTRTLDLGSPNGLQHYFLSSKPDAAGGWDMRGLVLEWDDGCGLSGTVNASPLNDSLYLPLTNGSSTVTITLRATGPKVRAPKPMWLLGYSPVVDYGSTGRMVVSDDGTQAALVLNRQDGMTLNLTFDRTWRPCKAPLYPAELAMPWVDDLEVATGGRVTYVGDGDAGTLTIDRPGEYELPAFGVDEIKNPSGLFANYWSGGSWIVVIDPSISWGGCHRYSGVSCGYDWNNEEYSLEYNYPLNSKCLWNAWQHNESGGEDDCTCEPEVRSGAEGSGAWLAETDATIDGGVAVGTVKIFGQTVWTGTCEHSYGDSSDDWTGGGTRTGCDLLTKLEECEECADSCTGGVCNYGEGSGLHSVKFRLPLASPRKGQTSAWIYFDTDTPAYISLWSFQWMKRDDANATHTWNGSTRTWTCSDNRGRDVVLSSISGGVRLAVTDHASGALDHTWDITNVNGSPNVIRLLRRNKRAQRMVDETYSYSGGNWSKTDNVSGLREELRIDNDINGSGQVVEERIKYDAQGNQLDRTRSVSTRIGSYANAVLRETSFEQDTGYATKRREASYWDDPAHAGRHGQLKLLAGNSTAWEYHDWNESGFETLRVEQRNGSAVPSSFPSFSTDGSLVGLGGIADATVTVFGYAPVGNDDRAAEDNGRARCETKYVVRNGVATCIAKTWTVYSHVTAGYYYPGLKVETYRAASPTAGWNDPGNAYSYVTVFDESADGVPLALRGRTAEELDENGRHVVHDAWDGWNAVYDYEYVDFGGVGAPTMKETVLDADYGLTLAEYVYTWDNYDLVSSEVSTYDDQNRLLTKTYKDGTSLQNTYSCCRKLTSRDRTGALTVRSAVTGEDKVYYAEEKTYLGELQTNGFEVVQHFMDALGREIRTVTYLGTSQGEATNATVSAGRELVEATASYPYGGDDYSERTDERGKRTVSFTSEYADRIVTEERVYPGASAPMDLRTVTTEVRNGGYVTETHWGNAWRREITESDYDATGCRTDVVVTETSDGVTVTNSATFCDFLGRAVTVVRPTGTDAIAYVGATSRKSGTVTTAGNVVRQTVPLYDAQGEEVGSFADGVTNRTDTVYETDEDWNAWKVTRTLQAAEGLTTVRETRERISGFASGVRSERVDIDANGVETTTVERYDAGDGLLHVTVTSPVAPAVERTSKYGLTVGERSGNVLVSKSYDAFGRCVDEKRSVGTGAAEPWKAYELNVLGDVVSAMTYTNATDASAETFSYDAYGRVVSATDALGNETVTAYDANGQVVEVSGATTPVRYGYDAQGNRTALRTTKDGTVWDTTVWTVDPATGRTTSKTYPDGTHVTTTYTPDGLPLRETRASGAWQQNAYDANRRLVGTSYSNPVLNASFVTDAFGRTAAETNAACGIAYLRSNDGTATNETWLIGEQGLSVGRTFDAFGRRAGLVLSADDDVTVACSYDAEGRIASVTAPDATVAYSYAADGNETGATVTLGGVTIRREVIREAYRGEQVVAVSNYVGGTAVDAVAVGYDAANRVVSQNGSNVAYNVRSEMTEAFGNEYAYLQNGDFAGRTLTTDVDGQVTTDGVRTFAYDAAGRLASVSSNGMVLATYAYDAQGRRVRKVTPTATSTYFYDGWLLVRELVTTTNGTERTDYVWGRDVSGTLDGAGGVGGLLYVKRGDSVCVPLYDNNGNVTAYVDGTGAVVARYAYDGFGNVTAESGTRAGEFRFRYSTKYADPESGLLYYGYRHYSPALRVWLTRDPLGENSGVNLHAFCNNNPLNTYDALGEIASIYMLGLRAKWYALSLWWQYKKGYSVAAAALVHSLQDHPSSPYSLPGAVSKVRNSPDYRKAFTEFLRKLPNGRWQSSGEGDDIRHAYEKNGGVSFEASRDLLYAMHEAELWIHGELCKVGGKVKCKGGLDVEIRDEYDFHYHDDEYRRTHPKEEWWLTLGNNMAYGDQEFKIIRPYTAIVSFRERDMRIR